MRPIRTLLLIFAACAGAVAFAAWSQTSSPPLRVPPALARLVAPRAAEMQAVGIQSINARTGRQILDIQVLTAYGPIYFSWPSNVTPVTFVIEVGQGGALTVRADGYTEADDARYAAAIEGVIPEAVRRTQSNNAWATRPKN